MLANQRRGDGRSLERLHELEALVRVSAQISRSLNLADVLTASITGIANVMNTAAACVLLINPATAALSIQYETAPAPELLHSLTEIADTFQYSPQDEPAQTVRWLGERVHAALSAQSIENFLTVPLITPQRALGLLLATFTHEKFLAPSSVDLLMSIGEQIGMALDNAVLYAQVRDAGEWSQAFIDNSVDAFVEFNTHGKTLYVNTAACELFGCDRATLMQRDLTDFVLSDEQTKMERFATLLQTGYLSNHTIKIMRADGTLRDASYSTRVVKDHQGQVVRYQAILRDMTEYVRALNASRQRAEEVSALNNIANILSDPLLVPRSLDLVCDEIVKITGMDAVIIYLIDESQQFVDIVACRGISPNLYQQMRRAGLDDPITRYVAIEGNVFAMNDLAAFQGEGIAGPRQEGYHAGIGVPIFKRGQPVGILEVGSKTQTTYDKSNIELLLTIGRQIGKALDNAELYTQMQLRMKELGVINAIAEILNHPLEIQHALDQVCEHIATMTNMETVAVYLNDDQNRAMYLLASRGLAPDLLAQIARVELDDPASHQVAVEGKLLALNDLAEYPNASFVGLGAEGYRAGIAAPILKRQTPMGAIFAGSKFKARYEQTDLNLLLNIGRQVGVALENHRLYTEMQQRVEELKGLAELAAACTTSLDLETITQLAVEQTARLLQTDVADLRLLNDNYLYPVASYAKHPELRWDENLELGNWRPFIVDERRTLIINDIQRDANASPLERRRMEPRGLRALLVMPLQTREQVVGTLAVLDHQPREWSSHEINLLQTIANQIGIATQNANLFMQMQRRVDELSGLNQLGIACNASLEPRELADIVVYWIRKLLPAHFVIVRLLEGDQMVLASKYTRRQVDLLPAMPMDEIFAPITHPASPLIVPDVAAANLPGPHRDGFLNAGMQAVLIVSMMARDRLIGAIALAYEEPHPWQSSEIDLLRTIAHQVGSAIDSAQLFQNVLNEQRKVQAIFDSGLSGLFATDAEGRLVMFNHAAESITGYKSFEVLGRKWEQLFADPAHPDITPLINDALNEKQTLFQMDGRFLRTRDGRILPVAKAVAPLINEKGNVTGAVGAFWDRSREKESEYQREVFLTKVAHEIGTPLSTVLSALELLQRPHLSEESRVEAFAVVKMQGERLRQFAVAFLDLEAGVKARHPVNLEPLPLRAVIEQVVHLYRENSTNHRIHIRNARGNVMVNADEDRLETILRNLIENAIHYSPANSLIQVSYKTTPEGIVQVSVRDQGNGIPLADQDKIFQPFYRSAQAEKRRVYGHGLGLAITKQCVQDMGGEIWVASLPGKGATFHFTLRRYR